MRCEFDVFASASNLSPELLDGSVQAKVESGRYLRLSAKDEVPPVTTDLWGEVWSHFSADHCPHTRAYITDFEYYKSDNEVEALIALK